MRSPSIALSLTLILLGTSGCATQSRWDQDGDGHYVPNDCDDQNAAIHPDAIEVCDGIDGDCSGAPDADELDVDGDGFALCEGDCDDANPSRSPGEEELCDGLDSNCSEGAGSTAEASDELDADGDGSLSCVDCNDEDATIHPGAPEICDAPTVDRNCDGLTGIDSPGFVADADGDGYDAVGCGGDDCRDDDRDPLSYEIHPGAIEYCDALDRDCDGSAISSSDGASPLAVEDAQAADSAPTLCFPVPVCSGTFDHVTVSSTEIAFFLQSEIKPGASESETAVMGLFGEPERWDSSDAAFSVEFAHESGERRTVRIFASGVVEVAVGEEPLEDFGLRCGGQETLPVRYDTLDAERPSTDIPPQLGNGLSPELLPFVPSIHAAQGRADLTLCAVTGEPDQDGDGISASCGDCDDRNWWVRPGRQERLDGVDNDCDGRTDWDDAQCAADLDGDGYRGCDGDPDDSRADVFPLSAPTSGWAVQGYFDIGLADSDGSVDAAHASTAPAPGGAFHGAAFTASVDGDSSLIAATRTHDGTDLDRYLARSVVVDAAGTTAGLASPSLLWAEEEQSWGLWFHEELTDGRGARIRRANLEDLSTPVALDNLQAASLGPDSLGGVGDVQSSTSHPEIWFDGEVYHGLFVRQDNGLIHAWSYNGWSWSVDESPALEPALGWDGWGLQRPVRLAPEAGPESVWYGGFEDGSGEGSIGLAWGWAEGGLLRDDSDPSAVGFLMEAGPEGRWDAGGVTPGSIIEYDDHAIMLVTGRDEDGRERLGWALNQRPELTWSSTLSSFEDPAGAWCDPGWHPGGAPEALVLRGGYSDSGYEVPRISVWAGDELLGESSEHASGSWCIRLDVPFADLTELTVIATDAGGLTRSETRAL